MTEASRPSDTDPTYGEYLVSCCLVAPEDLASARQFKLQFPFLRIGEILVGRGLLPFEVMVRTLSEFRRHSRLGQILVVANAITPVQLQAALDLQERTGLLLGKILVEMGACTLDDVERALEVQAASATAR